MAELTLTDVLNAIADMGRHFSIKLDANSERLDRLERDLHDFKNEMTTFKNEMTTFKNEMQTFQEVQKERHVELRTELKVVSARLDEQRQTINAMIPTRIAAVPPAAE
jgi:predicted phage tail protein